MTLAVLLAVAVSPSAASAATYLVDTAADGSLGTCASTSGPADCSLRDAITRANVSSSTDDIGFDSDVLPLAIKLDDPLPAVVWPVRIDASAVNAPVTRVTVSGSAAYATAYCAGSQYALDLTGLGAVGSQVYGLPMFGLCDRPLRSDIAPPTIRVGPRRYDGTLPVSGSSSGGDRVDLYFAAGPTTGAHEADALLASATATGGAYSLVPSPELTPGQKLTATASGATGTSPFAERVSVPEDIVSPTLLEAVAVSNSRVRLDFSEPIDPASAVAAAFSLAVGGLPRPVTAANAWGSSVFIDSDQPWQTGEAGSVAATGGARLTDLSGNELIGQPTAPVYAGPGELEAPAITSMRFSSDRVCKFVSARCKRGKTFILITLNKPARVIFNVLHGAHDKLLVTFVRRLDAGRNRVAFTSTVSGRRLPATAFLLRATAQDVARTLSAPVDAPFRVVTDRRDL